MSERLQKILRRLRNVDYVTRPRAQEDSQIYQRDLQRKQQEEGAMGGVGGQPPSMSKGVQPAPNLKANVLEDMALSMGETPQLQTTPLQPEATQESPYKKRVKFYNSMNKKQDSKYPELKPMSTLAGGGKSYGA